MNSPLASGEMTSDAFSRFLGEAFGLMISHVSESATFFACMDWRHIFEIAGTVRALDCELVNLCVWVKSNGGMGSLYRSRHELVFVFGKRGAPRENNVQLGRFGRNRTNVWNYPGANSFPRKGRGKTLDLHPTALCGCAESRHHSISVYAGRHVVRNDSGAGVSRNPAASALA